jgi:hypothetical protein
MIIWEHIFYNRGIYMINDHKIRIVELSSTWSWKRRLIIFTSIFGSIWLFIEPLLAFIGSANPLGSLGGWQYFILCGVSAVAVALTEVVVKQISLGRVRFVDFVITLIESGEQYHVEAPYDMRTENFIELFMNAIFATVSNEGQLSRHFIYDNTLMIKQVDGLYSSSSSEKTLQENGIIPGSDCRIEGAIKSNYVHIVYSRESADSSLSGVLRIIAEVIKILSETTSRNKTKR